MLYQLHHFALRTNKLGCAFLSRNDLCMPSEKELFEAYCFKGQLVDSVPTSRMYILALEFDMMLLGIIFPVPSVAI